MKIKTLFFLILALFFAVPSLAQVNAAGLKFDKTTISVGEGETFTLEVKVDAGTEKILSVDAYILFDSTLLEAQSVAEGTFFPVVSKNIQSGKVYIAGLVDSPSTTKTGEGTIGTITFKALSSGTGTITYDCRENASDDSKIVKDDPDAPDIIVCSENDTATLTIGQGGAESTESATKSPTLPAPSTLPQSGFADNLLKYSIPGLALILLGGILKFLL